MHAQDATVNLCGALNAWESGKKENIFLPGELSVGGLKDFCSVRFASRQDQEKPETWLSSKCTCPMCRSTFCILDVSMLHEPPEEAND